MEQITGIGIDVSKGYSMVAIRQPGGIAAPPFRVNHTASNLDDLINQLQELPGELRIVMEHTGGR